MLADSFGRPLRFILTPGQRGDILTAPALLAGFTGDYVLGDKAYDSNDFRQIIAETGAIAVIPSNRSRKVLIPHDPVIYKMRNLIEMLKQTQALQALRNPLRPQGHILPGLLSHRRRHDLDAMNVDSP
jgi:transposase